MDGWDRVDERVLLGAGREVFERASAGLMSWGMHRGAGLAVDSPDDVVRTDTRAVLRLGVGRMSLRAPVVVSRVWRGPTRTGFTYDARPGHPEIGTETFLVELEGNDAGSAGGGAAGHVEGHPADGETRVWLTITARSRPATWWSRAGGPVTRLVQRGITRRYVAAMRRIARGG